MEFAGFGDCLAEPEVEKDVNTEATDIRVLLLELLKKAVEGVRHLEFSFQDIVNTAHEAGVCGWALEGKEEHGDFILTHKSEIKFGKLLRKYAPVKPDVRRFRISASDLVQIHCTSRNQNRRHIIERE